MTTPIVTVIIPTYLDQNKEYLFWNLWSLNQVKIPIEVIIAADTPTPVDTSVLKNHPVKIINYEFARPEDRPRFPKKNNDGIAMAHPESQYFYLLNDDAFPTRGSIESMVEFYSFLKHLYKGQQSHEGQLMPCDKTILGSLSNCDMGLQFTSELAFQTKDNRTFGFPNQFDLSAVHAHRLSMEEMYEFQPFKTPFAFGAKRLFFYSVMIPRKTYELLGPLDETFKNSCEDFDYCIRAKAQDCRLMILQNAFTFHFSGKTASVTATNNERSFDQEYIMKKHGSMYYTVT